MRLTKIICTLGPASNSAENIERLAEIGMGIARINLSHGTIEQHAEVIKRIQALNAQGRCIAIMLDTKGCEIRTAEVEKPLQIAAGEEVVFSPKPLPNEKHQVVHVNYDGFAEDVKQTDRILLDNGFLQFDIVEIRNDGTVLAKAREDGSIGSRRHVNLPGADIALPSLTQKDWDDIAYGCSVGVDFVALSFIRNAREVEEVREFIAKHNGHMQIISKIETKQAVEHLAEIIDASDAVMVARGDLGAEIPFELIPAIQDDIVATCRAKGKAVIVATHMLESMIEHPMPTRAEVTDVAHAAVTRTDSTMLSGETAAGKHPFGALEAMSRILVETEKHLPEFSLREAGTKLDLREARAVAAVDMALSLGTTAIIVLTHSGRTAQAVSKYRPSVPVVAFTVTQEVQRRLQLSFGVQPHIIEFSSDPEVTVAEALQQAKNLGYVRSGDTVVLLSDTRGREELVSTVQVRDVA